MKYSFLTLYIILNFVCILSNQLNTSNESGTLIGPHSLIIRQANKKDFNKLKALLEKSPDIAKYAELDIEDALFYSYEQKTPFLICEDPYNNIIIAFIATSRSELHPDILHINSLGVDKNYRRAGIATNLLRRAYDFGRQNNYKKMSIIPADSNVAKYYQKFGFEGSTRRLMINLL